MNKEYLIDNGIDVLGSLDILGDMDMYNETLNDFLEEQKERMPKIEKYKNAGDMENYEILVHAIKGDSKYLGFTKLADLAYKHQIKSSEGNYEYINKDYPKLIAEITRITEVVKTYLGK